MQIKPTIAAELASPQVAMAQLPQTVAECHAVIVQLMEQVKVLEKRGHLDSKNSSKPPSSDGPGKPSRA